jgi:hypothetical protein
MGRPCPAVVVRQLPAGLVFGRLGLRGWRRSEEVVLPLLRGGAPMVAACRSRSVPGLLGLGGLQDLGPWLWAAWRHLAMEAACGRDGVGNDGLGNGG